jgi:hypothetical protein
MSNDFDSSDSDSESWILNSGKELVETRRYRISVFELKNKWEWQYREETQRSFLLGNIKVKPMKDREWYLELTEYGDQGANTAISLLHTPCHYGGYREWFECPGCFKRVGILYRDKSHFKCRKCLNLVYWLQKMNYNTLSPTIQSMHKLDKMRENKRRYFYAGKETRWFKRYKKLNWKVGGAMNNFSDKHSKE